MTGNSPPIYRRRRWLGPLLRILCLILGVLLLLAILCMAGFRKYIAYTETGKLYLDIPWLYGYMDGAPENDPLADCLTVTGGQEALPFYQQQSDSSSDEESDSAVPYAAETDSEAEASTEDMSSPDTISEAPETEKTES